MPSTLKTENVLQKYNGSIYAYAYQLLEESVLAVPKKAWFSEG